jgi:hypothetical protein
MCREAAPAICQNSSVDRPEPRSQRAASRA